MPFQSIETYGFPDEDVWAVADNLVLGDFVGGGGVYESVKGVIAQYPLPTEESILVYILEK